MKLKIKKFNFVSGRPICMIHGDTAKKLSFHVGQRILISRKKKKLICVLNTMEHIIQKNEIAVSHEISDILKLKPGNVVDVEIAEKPRSIDLIKEKLNGKKLNKDEIFEIIQNIANNSLTEVEVAFFVSAILEKGMSLEETKYLTQAMVETGNHLHFKGVVVDKHSIGGIAGNRTTPIVVSICAAAGLIFPKTSSRAITSAAGTADVIETIARVDFSIDDIKKIIKKTNGCFVWGGSLGLAPVDDKIIRVEKIVNADSSSQVIASILSKKISAGSKHILIDIPYGKSAKFSEREALLLKKRFLQMKTVFKLDLDVVLTKGDEPIGNGIGPVLEIKDVIKVLTRNNSPKDLEEKSLFLSGKILEMVNKARPGKGVAMARSILESGAAYKKFLEIIHAQKGNVNLLDSLCSNAAYDIKSRKKIKIKHLNNKLFNTLARLAGCPEDKASGIYLYKKKGNDVDKGETIFTIYAVSKEKLRHAINFFRKNERKIIEIY
ncbi:thymidine phosphorylase [Candidatus Pacearchaeota archaeon]|nr:thymidine phosphorylase [Candidatus Pacearchaeota archaeon]